MPSVNKVIVVGRLGRDPELRNTTSGNSVCSLTIATDESYIDKNGSKVEQTEWHRVSVFGKIAENCNQYLHKGSLAYVEGRLTTRKYTDKDGIERQITEIRGDRVQFLDSKGGSGQGSQPQAKAPRKQSQPKPQAQAQGDYDTADDVPFS